MIDILYKNPYFYLTLFALFFLDICSLALFEKYLLYLLLCFFVAQMYQPTNVVRLSLTALLISLESFFYYGRFGMQLLYLIPAVIIGLSAKKMFYKPGLQPYVVLLACLLVQCLFIEPYLLGMNVSFTYTLSKIIANIIVLLLISLK